MMRQYCPRVFLFFFNDTATTEIYTLSLHDALPICVLVARPCAAAGGGHKLGTFRRGSLELRHLLAPGRRGAGGDRKSTRLNSSHGYISYAVFCLKKKKQSLNFLRKPIKLRFRCTTV